MIGVALGMMVAGGTAGLVAAFALNGQYFIFIHLIIYWIILKNFL